MASRHAQRQQDKRQVLVERDQRADARAAVNDLRAPDAEHGGDDHGRSEREDGTMPAAKPDLLEIRRLQLLGLIQEATHSMIFSTQRLEDLHSAQRLLDDAGELADGLLRAGGRGPHPAVEPNGRKNEWDQQNERDSG